MVRSPGFFALLLAVVSAGCSGAPQPWTLLAGPSSPYGLVLFEGKAEAARFGAVGWGPGGTPLSLTAETLALESRMDGPRTLVTAWTLMAAQDTPVDLLALTLAAPVGGSLSVSLPGVRPDPVTLPSGPGPAGTVDRLTFRAGPRGQGVQIRSSAPVEVAADGTLRLVLARGKVPAGKRVLTLTFTFPADAKYLGTREDLDRLAPLVPGPGWFPWAPTGAAPAGGLGMEGWLGVPAGLHGGVREAGEGFRFEDGTPARFWGVNLSFGASAPSRSDAELTAARLARAGVNGVRMHKFTGPGWEGIGDPDHAALMDGAGLDRLDWFASRLAARGVYYGWSHSYQFKVRPGDRARLTGFDELMAQGGNTYGVINWAEDVQDLMIEMIVNLLKHKNPYTGKTYAEDPALSFLELQNEDDIFFYTSDDAYRAFPTYRTQLLERFARWLADRYGTQEALAAAWQGALKSGETLAAASVAVQPNPWFMGTDHLPKTQGGERRRLLDNAAFLHDTQNRFYTRFTAAVRAAGYKGPVTGSNWGGPDQVPRLYNLKSDFLTGFIDRHAYFGEALDDTILGTPGGGFLGAGQQQAAGRPFVLSEWIHVYPSLLGAEGPVLVGAYGMGLQGWDASYQFQSDSAPPDNRVGWQPWGVWNADVPAQIGQYPTVARMVLRGDVSPGPVLGVRKVGPGALAEGRFDFSGDFPAGLLAAGRVLTDFTGAAGVSSVADLDPFRSGTSVRSATGQLDWDAGSRTVRIDTPGTQGFVGFAAGRRMAFADAVLETSTPYASVLVTALSPKGTLATDRRALVSAVARNANTGMRVSTLDGKAVVENGTGPILVEPVSLRLGFPGRPGFRVTVLDQDGRETTRVLAPDAAGSVSLDTGRDRTLWYLVTF